MIRRLKISLTFAGLSVLFIQFQNCANVHSSPSASSTSGTVQLVDNYNKSDVQFPESSVQLFEEASTVPISGICNRSRDGQPLEWNVSSASGSLASGQSACGDGQFSFDLANVSPWVCGVSYKLTVTASWGEEASMDVVKRCQPLASQNLPAQVVGQPLDCRLEYRLGDNNQMQCASSCYLQGVLASEEDRAVSDCQSLVQKLSGQ